ncbi:MAG: ABC transporter ATP-binding protein [Eggerthellaceae bacterium]|nr:ABC transporter ATP-binding protein [Eggerthellaceae bacterium]
MPRYTINSQIERRVKFEDDASKEVMVDVDHVSMIFNMASEQLNSLKEYFIAIAHGELRFKELRALNDVSFTVRKGDVFGILGTNGSGKSTMLKVVAGVLEPSEGSVTVNGHIAPLIELGAGFDMDLTARENIYLNGALLGYSKEFINQHFDEIVEFAEVQDFLDIPLKNYSSGMVARIAFAIATIIVPDLLIVDEVLAVGDFMFQQKCEDRIRTLIEEYDVTVLIVSHDTNQIERLCNKAIWIEKGNTRILGDAKEVCGLYRLLGGRVGSNEAEKAILDALNFEFDEESIEIPRSICGTDRFDTAIKLSEAAECIDSPAMVLFNDTRSIDAYIATSVCGFLNTTPQYLHNDAIPSATTLTAFKSRPQTVYAIGTKTSAEEIARGLSHEDYTPLVTVLESDLCLDSTETYRHFKSMGATWNSTAIVYSALDPNYGISLLSLMPYVYVNHTPVFNVDGEEGPERILDVIGDFKRIVFVGTTKGRVTKIYEYATENGLEIVHFDGKEPYDANEQVNDWIAEEWAKDGYTSFRIVVSSLTNTIDNTIVGAFAGSLHALLLFEDVKDIDSVSKALTYVGNHAQMIEGFEFLGDGNRFDNSEKLLICKRLAMAKAQEAEE